MDTWTSPEAGICAVAANRASDAGGASQVVGPLTDAADRRDESASG